MNIYKLIDLAHDEHARALKTNAHAEKMYGIY